MIRVNGIPFMGKKILLGLIFSVVSAFAFEHLTSDNIQSKVNKGEFIVDFYATWCPPCRVVAKNLVELDKSKPSSLTIYKVDIDKQMDLAKQYGIVSLPTLVYIKDSKVLLKQVGIKNTKEIRDNVESLFN